MNRPIKFRGYDTDFPMAGTVTFTLDDLLAESESYGLVHPDSIAQLVGFDEVGNEVYEGDIVIDEFGHEVAAKLFDNLEFGRVALKEVHNETTD